MERIAIVSKRAVKCASRTFVGTPVLSEATLVGARPARSSPTANAPAAPAEEAFRTAVAVAKQQSTRSFELRAALSLAKLYQSTRRPADAHAVLAPALEGFSPTPEMPEIAEARALLGELSNRAG